MKLYLLRHGPAEDQAASGRDADRALTPSGRVRVREVAEKLLEQGETPRFIVSSPLVRAIQTAEIVAMAMPGSGELRVEVRREMAPGGQVASLARTLAVAGRKRVMLVGHEPDLSAAAAALLGDFRQPFDKAMVVGVHLSSSDPTPARLRFVLDPRTLELSRAPQRS